MKNIETFFEMSNYDSKNITNKGTQIIEQKHLTKIENEGVTLEFLNALGMPVFKYKTQITIHGLFPELQKNYLGGYKNLFQNKNLSIGVKWQAVDYLKKDKIYSYITRFAGWRKQHNSSEFFIYKTSEIFRDKETYKTLLEVAKNEVAHINKDLFFGNCGVYLSQTLWGGYFLVTYINIGAILETNVDACIENITKASIAEIEIEFAKRKAKAEQEQKEREAERVKELQERAAKQAPIKEAARKILSDAGYILQEKQEIETDKLYIKIETDIDTGKFIFVAYKFSKELRQKKFRVQEAKSNNLEFDFEGWQSTKRETIWQTFSGWVLPKTDIKEVQIEPIKEAKTNHNGIILVNYSEKAIAIFGDTKPVKEIIKEMGGRFNPYLNHNGQKEAGWILPLSKIEQAKELIGKS